MAKPLSAVETAFCEWWESVRHEDIEGGYEQGVALDAWRVAYCIAEKQARAEVLAACASMAESFNDIAATGGRSRPEMIRDAILNLQPAAKDLEDHDKQVQLELLASFLRRIDLSLIEGYAATTTPAYNEALTDLRDGYMKDFKLVASALEELLREERKKCADYLIRLFRECMPNFEEIGVRRSGKQGEEWLICFDEAAFRSRILELEMARAIPGDQK